MMTKFVVKFNRGTRLPNVYDTKEEASKVAFEYGSYKGLCYVDTMNMYTEEEVQKMLESL